MTEAEPDEIHSKALVRGRECDVRNEGELRSASANLAHLHKLMCGEQIVEEGQPQGSMILEKNIRDITESCGKFAHLFGKR